MSPSHQQQRTFLMRKKHTLPPTMQIKKDKDSFHKLGSYLEKFAATHGTIEEIKAKQLSFNYSETTIDCDLFATQPQIFPYNELFESIFYCSCLIKMLESNGLTPIYLKNKTDKKSTVVSKWILSEPKSLNFLRSLYQIDYCETLDYQCHQYTAVMDVIKNTQSTFLFPSNLVNRPDALMQVNKEGDWEYVGNIVNDVIANIYEAINTPHFIGEKRQRVRRSNIQFQNTEKYLEKLREENDCITLITLDLCCQVEENESLSKLTQSFSEFKHLLRRSSKFNLLGYFWKLIQGYDGFFYYHCMFFFEKFEQIDSDKITWNLIDSWIKKVRTNFDNPKNPSDFFKNLSIGTIASNDHELHNLLLNMVIRYYCFKDCFIINKNLVGRKTFDTARVSSKKRHLGRPVIAN